MNWFRVLTRTTDLDRRLRAVDWRDVWHPCYPRSMTTVMVPRSIRRLFSHRPRRSLHAAWQLWNFVAHQGAVGSNSVPTLPFLVERVQLSPSLRVLRELVEIIYYFSDFLEVPDTSAWTDRDWDAVKSSFGVPDDFEWIHALRQELCRHELLFRSLAKHPDSMVSEYATCIVENLAPHVAEDPTAVLGDSFEGDRTR